MKDNGKFVKKYHKALVMANKNDIEKMKPKIASQWVKEWMEQLDGKITDEQEFTARFEEFLSDELGFADISKVSIDDGHLLIDVQGCAICPGNELLREAGEDTMCPILSTGLMSINRVLGKKATLEGVDKEGKEVGYCTIKYDLAEKGA
ncbi:MAG: hypothetical protein JW738_03980 [Actinobacteria bacterium]|nr:hypothetical protein [Actinomycetota bacterium]